MMFDVGALTTITPACVAALMSTLSRPTPARAMTLRFFAAAMASASTCVAERIRIASTSAIAESSWERSAPSVWRISKSGPRASTVAGESSSARSTTGLVLVTGDLFSSLVYQVGILVNQVVLVLRAVPDSREAGPQKLVSGSPAGQFLAGCGTLDVVRVLLLPGEQRPQLAAHRLD